MSKGFTVADGFNVKDLDQDLVKKAQRGGGWDQNDQDRYDRLKDEKTRMAGSQEFQDNLNNASNGNSNNSSSSNNSGSQSQSSSNSSSGGNFNGKNFSTGHGVSGDYFGHQDYNAARAEGATDEEITNFLDRNPNLCGKILLAEALVIKSKPVL